MSEGNSKSGFALSEQEKKLILMIRQLQYGQVLIHVSEGKPVRAEEIKKSIKL